MSSSCSREIKPKPLSALKNFTVPCATKNSFLIATDQPVRPIRTGHSTAWAPWYRSCRPEADRAPDRWAELGQMNGTPPRSRGDRESGFAHVALAVLVVVLVALL